MLHSTIELQLMYPLSIYRKLYWSNSGSDDDDDKPGSIWHANLDGSDPKVLIENAKGPNVNTLNVKGPSSKSD